MDDHSHWRSAMPNAFEPVSSCSDDHGGFLSSPRAPLQSGQIIAHELKCIQQIIEVLNFGNGPQTAHGKTYRLAKNSCLTNSGVENTVFSVFNLKAFQPLVYTTYFAGIFSENDYLGIFFQNSIEIIPEDLPAIHLLFST